MYIFFANRPFKLYVAAALMGCGLFVYGAFSAALPLDDPWRTIGAHLFITAFWQWYLGAWLAEIYVKYKSRFVGPTVIVYATRCSVVALSFLIALVDPTVFKLHIMQWIFPFLCLLMVALFLINGRKTGGLVSSWLVHLGDMSYSLYLVHPLAIWIFVMLPPTSGPAWIWRGGFSLIVSILFASIGYQVVEKPLLLWRRSLREPSRGATAAESGGASAKRRVENP